VLWTFRPFSGWHFQLKSGICNGCNTSPVIGVIRAHAYTSIREVLLQVSQVSQVSQDGLLEDRSPF
jgi:hypothetical protein